MLATFAVRLVVVSVILRTVCSDNFLCSVNITGSSVYAENLMYSSVSVHCTSEKNDGAQLPLLLHDSLEPHQKSIIGTRNHRQVPCRQQHSVFHTRLVLQERMLISHMTPQPC